jgi:uncharacterized membrane protein YbhN (UPF0104 family)
VREPGRATSRWSGRRATERDNDRIARDRPRRRPGARGRLAIRIALSVGLLGLLIWQLPEVSWRDLRPGWHGASGLWLTAAVVSTAGAFALSTLRWRAVLRPLHAPPPFGRMLSHFLAGQFVSNVLPTAFGGDVVRIARLGEDVRDVGAAFASVTIERLTGWLVLPLITLATLAGRPELRGLGSATSTAVATAAVTLVALGAILAAAANRRWTEGAIIATGWRRWLAAVHLGIDALRRTPRQIAAVLAAGMAFQLLQCVVVWCLARAIGVEGVGLWAALAFFPAAAVIQNLPIGIGGLGVREGAFVLFFGAVGTPRGQAITLGLAVYLVTVATSALGAPAFALGGGTRRRGPGTLAGSASDPHDPGPSVPSPRP